ncbi:MAG: beta-lactamase family protein [Planctomycetes bacterium]|nr:beta-lactamase family protein [Planctomycetota bacterium]
MVLLAGMSALPNAGTAQGQTPLPAASVTPQIEARAREWFERSQHGDPDRAQLSADANRLLTPALVKGAAKALGSLGPLTALQFVSAQNTGKWTEYQFIATTPKQKLIWIFGLDADGKVAFLRFGPYVEHIAEARLVPDLRNTLREEAAAGRFSGAVLITKDGTPVLAEADGFADRARRVKNTLRTRFRMGSMNKMFTAVAILQLVQDGKVSLDAPFGTYLKDYPNAEVASTVTVAQLLTHTGGTGDIFDGTFDKHRLALRTLSDYVHSYGHRGLAFTPGSRWEYSNYGYIVLGAVIEAVTGQSYYDYVSAHVFAPAGMSATGSEPESSHVPGLSIGYMRKNGRVVPNTTTLPYRATSAGGGYTTVEDLQRFADALVRHRLLDAHYTEVLVTGKFAMPSMPGERARYAYGFVDHDPFGTHCFGHDGGAPGMNGDLEICPAAGYVVAILANADPPIAESLAATAIQHMPAR